MNKKETQKIANELKTLGFKITNNRSNILWFAQKEYTGLLNYRDKEKNLCIAYNYFSVHFKADINPNGVGDGKQPEIALTYSLDFYNPGKIRLYRHKYFHPTEHFKFYSYSRNLKELIEKFKNHLTKINTCQNTS